MFPISQEKRALFCKVLAQRAKALEEIIVLFDEYMLFAGERAVTEAIAPKIHLALAAQNHFEWSRQPTFAGLKFHHCEQGLNAALQFAHWLRDGDSDYEKETRLDVMADQIIEIIEQASAYPELPSPASFE